MFFFARNHMTRAVLLSAAVLLTSFSAGAITVTNGSFEDIQISTPFSTNPADIPGWTHSGSGGDALLWRAGPQCCGGTGTAKAGSGNQFVTMGGGFGVVGSAAWSQTISGFTIGQTYQVNFLLASEGETPTQQITVGFTSGSNTPAELVTSSPTSTLFWQNWGPAQYTFVASATAGTLQFSVTNQAYDVGLDDVSITTAATTTPEPNLFPILGVALVGLAALARRL